MGKCNFPIKVKHIRVVDGGLKQSSRDVTVVYKHSIRNPHGRRVGAPLRPSGSRGMACFEGRVIIPSPQDLSLKGVCHPNWREVCWRMDERMTAMENGSITLMINMSMALLEEVRKKHTGLLSAGEVAGGVEGTSPPRLRH